MNDSNRSNRIRISALALSGALTMAAAIGLTTASEYQEQGRASSTHTNSQCVSAATDGGADSLPPAFSTPAPNDDPELMRIDRANDHHG